MKHKIYLSVLQTFLKVLLFAKTILFTTSMQCNTSINYIQDNNKLLKASNIDNKKDLKY